jgi:hypothetical protein
MVEEILNNKKWRRNKKMTNEVGGDGDGRGDPQQ